MSLERSKMSHHHFSDRSDEKNLLENLERGKKQTKDFRTS